jgi:hydroxyacid-oxoacid transhydrogenase
VRTTYQGSNPISDVWAHRAVQMAARNILRAIRDDADARSEMLLAATFAGVGFGNAGVHLCHGMSYPVSGLVKTFRVDGYPRERALVPHGMSVVLTAPAVFRWTASTDPPRHLEMAAAMGVDTVGVPATDAGECLAAAIIDLMRATGMPTGLRAIGYTEADLDRLVEGTAPQHRVTKLSPRPVTPAALRELFRASMVLW